MKLLTLYTSTRKIRLALHAALEKHPGPKGRTPVFSKTRAASKFIHKLSEGEVSASGTNLVLSSNRAEL